MTDDELECQMAVLVSTRFIRGYISHKPLFLVVANPNRQPDSNRAPIQPFPKVSEVLKVSL